MTSAARAALDRVARRMDLVPSGIGFVIVPAGEQQKHAAVLAEAPGRAVVEMASLPGDGASRWMIVPGLPSDGKAAVEALAHFNGMRNRLIDAGCVIVVVVSRRQLTLVEQHAPDVASARIFAEEVPFEPDPTVDEAEAREELLRYYKEKFGKLDLRGFIRSETEDVAWGIEELYQDLEGRLEPKEDEKPVIPGRTKVVNLLGPLKSLVILGHPGAGKTFFLRWLALQMSRATALYGIERPIPLICSLAAYADARGYAGLVEYLVDTLVEARQGAAHLVERAVEEGRAVFLLDGLDEVGNESSRRAMAEAIAALRARAGRCLIVVTSRIAGYERSLLPSASIVTLSPFEDSAIRAFLIQWCELYAIERTRAREEGRAEGEQLANDVIAHREIVTLARNPLLLTVLAIVHRAGVRLPDHRIELYEHATKVLVERWNRVRGLAAIRSAPPIKAADAVRLLGPIALEMVRSDIHGVIHEEDLRRMLHKALSGGELRGVATADEAIVLFRSTLGLLVEQGPGVYSFIHLTLAEYFAAWELVRTGSLEDLIQRETEVFSPKWREVVLLAAGELGVIRADDARLSGMVERLIQSAGRSEGYPVWVPSLLGGLLADDPGLSRESIDALVNKLVPVWWFDDRYDVIHLPEAIAEANSILVRRGQAGSTLRQAIIRCYPGEYAFYDNWEHRPVDHWGLPDYLRLLELDWGASES